MSQSVRSVPSVCTLMVAVVTALGMGMSCGAIPGYSIDRKFRSPKTAASDMQSEPESNKPTIAGSPDKLRDLRSLVNHRSLDDFVKDKCAWTAASNASGTQGKQFFDVFPVNTIKAIDLQSDEVTLPTAYLLHCLATAKFGALAKTVGLGVSGKVWLTNANCFEFQVLFDAMDRSASAIHTPMGTLIIPKEPAVEKFSTLIKPGMTRLDVEKVCTADGGIASPFRCERYIANGSNGAGANAVVKLNIAFKPAGMTDAVYYLGKWAPPKQGSGDVVMRVSPPYPEVPFMD